MINLTQKTYNGINIGLADRIVKLRKRKKLSQVELTRDVLDVAKGIGIPARKAKLIAGENVMDDMDRKIEEGKNTELRN